MLTWGPPCMKVSNGCDLRRFGSIKIVSTGYRSGIGSTDDFSSRRAFSTEMSTSDIRDGQQSYLSQGCSPWVLREGISMTCQVALGLPS